MILGAGPGRGALHQQEELLEGGARVLHQDIPVTWERGLTSYLNTSLSPPRPPPSPRMLNIRPPDQWCQVARAYTTCKT